MTVKEFFEEARKAGLRGPAVIMDRRRYLGIGMGDLELSMENGENGLIEAYGFSRTVTHVAFSPCPKSKANAMHRGRGYYIKDL